MILVIDGFNLIYKFNELEPLMYKNQLEMAMMGLINHLLILRKEMKKTPQIHVFFDGKKKQGDDTLQEEIDGIYCYYSHDTKADSLIEDFIKDKKARNISGIRVISSDKAIQKFVKRFKYECQSSEDFYIWYKTITQKKIVIEEKPKDLSNQELEYWLRIFQRGKKNL